MDSSRIKEINRCFTLALTFAEFKTSKIYDTLKCAHVPVSQDEL